VRVVKVERIRFTTYGPNKLFDLTDRVLSLTHSVEEGAVFLQAVGSTGALLVLPRSEEVLRAFEQDLWDLVPTLGWRHPGNAYAHLRSTLMGTTLALPVVRGEVLLRGSGVFFLENQPAMNRPRVVVAALLENRAR